MESLKRNLRVVARITHQGSKSWEASAQDQTTDIEFPRETERHRRAGGAFAIRRLLHGKRCGEVARNQECNEAGQLPWLFSCLATCVNPVNAAILMPSRGTRSRSEKGGRSASNLASYPAYLYYRKCPYRAAHMSLPWAGQKLPGRARRLRFTKSTLFVVKATIRANPSAETGFPGELSR
jgi:hypothetical protein